MGLLILSICFGEIELGVPVDVDTPLFEWFPRVQPVSTSNDNAIMIGLDILIRLIISSSPDLQSNLLSVD